MKKLNPNDAPAGYVAVADSSAKGCSRCELNETLLCHQTACTALRRADGCGVIFIRSETPPPEPLDARHTIRLPASVKAKAQRIGAAAVIAAIVAAEDVE